MRRLKVSELVRGTIFTIPGSALIFKLMDTGTYDRSRMSDLDIIFGEGDKVQRVAILRGQEYQTLLSTYIGTKTETDLELDLV